MSKKNKCALQVIIASGPRDIGRAALGFAFATSAAVSNIKVHIVLASDGVAWIKKNQSKARQKVGAFGSIAQFLDILAENGAVISVCSACLQSGCLSGVCGKKILTKFPAAGLSELAVRMCKPGVTTVVF